MIARTSLHALVPVLLAVSLAAEDAPAPAAGGDRQLSVSAGLLWQAFRNAGEDYAISELGVASTNDGPVEQGGEGMGLGFALGLAWKPAGSTVDYGLDISLLSNDVDDSISDPNDLISSTQTHPDDNADIAEEDIGRATAQVETSLMRISLLMGSRGKLDNGLDYGIRGGLTYMQFENDRAYNYYDNDTPTAGENHVLVERSQEFTGYGVTIDGTLRTRFAHGFSAFGVAGLSLLTGTSDISVRETEPDDGVTNVDDDTSIDHLVTAIKLAVGVAWEKAVGNGSLAVELSYELESLNGLKRDIKYTDDVNDATITQTSDDIGVDGLRLNVAYAF